MTRGLGQALSGEIKTIIPQAIDEDALAADFFGQSRAEAAKGGDAGPAIPIDVLRAALPSRYDAPEDAESGDGGGDDGSDPLIPDIEMTENDDGETISVTVADGDARPAHAGGGKNTDSTDSTSSGGKGYGKTKDKTVDNGATDGTDGGTGGTDTGTGGTDTGTGGTDTGTGGTDGGTSGGTTVTPDYVSGLDTPDGFNIEVIFEGAWTDALIAQFTAATETLSDIITGDLPDVNGIDDVRITASITSIDGSGGVAGRGGFDTVRADTHLVSEGHVSFDSADTDTLLKYGIFDDMALHEMVHSLGFGSGWSMFGLVENYDGDLRFVGETATAVYNSQYADIAASDPLSLYGVPIETDGSSGSAGSHWDEATFGREIMTPTLSTSNTLSDLTIAALDDMGYDTVIDTFLFV